MLIFMFRSPTKIEITGNAGAAGLNQSHASYEYIEQPKV